MARGRKDYEKAVVAVESEGFVNPHGRILMHDDFEDTPLKWYTTGTGTHSETRQASAAYNGSFGLELNLIAAAPPVADGLGAYRFIPIDVTERLLLEHFWRVNNLARLQYFDTHLRFYDGANYHSAGVRYDAAATAWYYYVAAGAWVAIPGGEQVLYASAWNELTLSVDFLTNEYILFKSNNLEVNLGGIGCWNPGSVLGAHAEIRISAYNNTADRLIVSIDDAIVRELER